MRQLPANQNIVQSDFDPACTRCPRLAEFLCGVRAAHPDYHARPVPSFGPVSARLLIVGLAPGMHGANASGRPFTGDYAGILLYQTLYKFGLASRPVSESRDDGLQLHGCRITNAVKCLPPGNKPTSTEITTCNGFLRAEIEKLTSVRVILALGRIAHTAVIRAFQLRQGEYHFAHAAEHRLPDRRILLDSYHCSRYNTQTRRLTTEMFETVIASAASHATSR